MREQNFGVLFYASLQPMWVFDVSTLQIIEVNSAAVKRYAYTKKEFLSKTIMDLRAQEDIPLIVKVLPDIRGTKTRYREFKHIGKNGRVINVEIMSYPFVYKGINSRLVIAQNIDEKKVILGRLDFTEFKLEQILEETKIGFVQLDYRSTVVYWNKAAERLIGYKREYTNGKNLWDVFPELKGSDFYHHYERAMQNRETIEFVEYFWPIQKWFNIDIYPVPDGVIVNFNDVTSKQRIEERLRKKIDQMSEVSFLNSHYIRKPVASLLGLTNLFSEGMLNHQETAETIGHIRNCALELDDTIRKINAKVNNNEEFDDPEDGMEDFSVNALLKHLIEFGFDDQLTHKIIQKKKTDFLYYGNRKVISSAMQSLLSNAIKNSPNASKIIVDRQVVGNNLVLSVKDFGVGIDQYSLNKIFLSFTKKTVARELGSGLLKVNEAANKHNGSVWVESTVGKGATFSIRFPLLSRLKLKIGGKWAFTDFKSTGIEIEFIKGGNYIIADWKGFHSLHTVKTGCIKLLEAINLYKCNKLLNNNSNVLGSWDGAVEWVANEWFPLALSSGLTHIGWVYSASTFSRLSVDHTIKTSKQPIVHQVFSNVDNAHDWLTKLIV